MSNDPKKTNPPEEMTKGEIILRLAVCIVVFEIFFLICIASVISWQMPNVFVFGFSLVSVLALAAFFIPSLKAEWRGRRTKKLQNLFWIFVSINVAIMWLFTGAVLDLTTDDKNFIRHPTLDAVRSFMNYPVIIFPDGDSFSGFMLNCLVWGFAIGYGCRFIFCWIMRRKTQKDHL